MGTETHTGAPLEREEFREHVIAEWQAAIDLAADMAGDGFRLERPWATLPFPNETGRAVHVVPCFVTARWDEAFPSMLHVQAGIGGRRTHQVCNYMDYFQLFGSIRPEWFRDEVLHPARRFAGVSS